MTRLLGQTVKREVHSTICQIRACTAVRVRDALIDGGDTRNRRATPPIENPIFPWGKKMLGFDASMSRNLQAVYSL